MIPGPIWSLSSRPGCTHKPSICLERPANGTLPQNPNPVVGKHRRAACCMILKVRVSGREMTRTETDAWGWSSLVKIWDDAILGWEKEKPQRSWCGNRRTLPWRTRCPANKGVKMFAELQPWEKWCRSFQVSIHLYLKKKVSWEQSHILIVLSTTHLMLWTSMQPGVCSFSVLASTFAWHLNLCMVGKNGGIYSAKVTSQPHNLLRNVWKAIFWHWFSHKDVVAQKNMKRGGENTTSFLCVSSGRFRNKSRFLD